MSKIVFLGLALSTVVAVNIHANALSDFLWTLENKWKPNTNLEIEGNSKWVVRLSRYYGAGEFLNICKNNNNNNCLHIENGYLEMGKIKDGWWSSSWKIIPTYNGFIKIQNKWKPKQYLNIEYGDLKSTTIRHGWWSSQWKAIEIPAD